MEIYSYEFSNTASNVLQSARKLGKNLTEFASFKKNSAQNNYENLLAQMPSLFNNALTNSTNNHSSYSMNKFKLIAKATLNQKDLSDDIQTRSLSLFNGRTFISIFIFNFIFQLRLTSWRKRSTFELHSESQSKLTECVKKTALVRLLFVSIETFAHIFIYLKTYE